jgi:hypothetical protein
MEGGDGVEIRLRRGRGKTVGERKKRYEGEVLENAMIVPKT